MPAPEVKFSSPALSPDCPTCGGPYTRCACTSWAPEQTNSDARRTAELLTDGFHIWDGDRPRSLGQARWTDLPGIIRDIITDTDHTDPEDYAELLDWLAELGYSSVAD